MKQKTGYSSTVMMVTLSLVFFASASCISKWPDKEIERDGG